MPYDLWAKISLGIIDDTKLVRRPEWQRWLWLGMICLAKKYYPEEGICPYSAESLRGLLMLTVPASKIRAALASFEQAGMVQKLEENRFLLVNFVKRQGVVLTPTKGRRGYVYFARARTSGHIKIGYSSNPWARLNDLQAGSADTIELVATAPGTPQDERRLHDQFKACRFNREWFTATSEISALVAHVAATKLLLRSTAVAGTTGATREVDVEEEKEEDLDPKQIADPAARAPDPWPAELFEQLRVALGRQLETNDAEWARFKLDTTAQFPLVRRVNAAQAFLQRRKPGQKYGPGYLFKLIREGVEPTANGNGSHSSTEFNPIGVEATEEMLKKLRRPKNPMPEHMRSKK